MRLSLFGSRWPLLLGLVLMTGMFVAASGPARAEPIAAIDTERSPGIAVSGYDPVAYFTEGRPVRGLARFSLRHKGAEWRFASAANRDRFVADPARYSPQFGGYCAYAVSEGRTASSDPEAWTIRDGRLYLNYDREVAVEWLKDVDRRVRQGHANWPTIARDARE